MTEFWRQDILTELSSYTIKITVIYSMVIIKYFTHK